MEKRPGRRIPPTLKYEPGTTVAEGDFVIVHGRFSGFGAPVNWIAADIVRIEAGIIAEHWTPFYDLPAFHSAYNLVIADPMAKPQAKMGKFLNLSGTT